VVGEAFDVREPAQAPSSSLGYGPGDRVLAGALGARRQAQRLFLAGARRRDDGGNAQNAFGQRPVLSRAMTVTSRAFSRTSGP